MQERWKTNKNNKNWRKSKCFYRCRKKTTITLYNARMSCREGKKGWIFVQYLRFFSIDIEHCWTLHIDSTKNTKILATPTIGHCSDIHIFRYSECLLLTLLLLSLSWFISKWLLRLSLKCFWGWNKSNRSFINSFGHCLLFLFPSKFFTNSNKIIRNKNYSNKMVQPNPLLRHYIFELIANYPPVLL